jgi:hypothetical protein
VLSLFFKPTAGCSSITLVDLIILIFSKLLSCTRDHKLNLADDLCFAIHPHLTVNHHAQQHITPHMLASTIFSSISLHTCSKHDLAPCYIHACMHGLAVGKYTLESKQVVRMYTHTHHHDVSIASCLCHINSFPSKAKILYRYLSSQ